MATDLGLNKDTWSYFLSNPCKEICKVTCKECSHDIEYTVDDMSHYYIDDNHDHLRKGFIYNLINKIPYIIHFKSIYNFLYETEIDSQLYYKIKCPNCNKDITIIPGRKPTKIQLWYNYNILNNLK